MTKPNTQKKARSKDSAFNLSRNPVYAAAQAGFSVRLRLKIRKGKRDKEVSRFHFSSF